MVTYAYTVIDPWTMMIIAFHTDIANSTMSRTWSADDFTVWTEISWVKLIQKLQKLKIIVWPQAARISS